MSNGSIFAAGAVGGAVGSIGGAVLTQPGGARRVLGVVGTVITVILTGVVAAVLVNAYPSTPSIAPASAVPSITLAGVLWLPWVAAKASFPWTKFRWHWAVTRELVGGRHPYGMTVLITMVLAAIVAIVAAGTGARGFSALAFILYVLCGLLWGFLTASVVRQAARAEAHAVLE